MVSADDKGGASCSEKVPLSPCGTMMLRDRQCQQLAIAAQSSWFRGFCPSYWGVAQTETGFAWKPTFQDIDTWFPPENNFIACLTPVPPFLRKEKTDAMEGWKRHYPPTDWQTYTKMLQWLATGTLRNVKYFEVVNEPDAVWQAGDAALVTYHRKTAEAIKAVRPDAQILGPCLYSIDLVKLDKLVKMGILDHLDGISIHNYASGTAPEGRWFEQIKSLSEYLASVGKPELPIFLTEFGWPSTNSISFPGVGELNQARYLTRSFLLLKTIKQYKAFNWFVFYYKPSPQTIDGFSMLHDNKSPKPAYTAYAVINRWLSGTNSGGSLYRPAPDTYLAVFRHGQEAVLAAWTTSGKRKIWLPEVKTAEDFLGNRIAVSNGLIEISESPVFIKSTIVGPPTFVNNAAIPKLISGSSFTLPQGKWYAPSPLEVKQNQLLVPENAPHGEYSIFSNDNGKWQGIKVDVTAPFTIADCRQDWPANAPTPELAVKITSASKQDFVVKPVMRQKNGLDIFWDSFSLSAGSMVTCRLPLKNYQNGKPIIGCLNMEARDEDRYINTNIPLTLTFAAALKNTGEKNQKWDWIDVNGWSRASQDLKKDCAAKFSATYNDKGLYLRVQINDNVFRQERKPGLMWKEDSIQVAFDIDAATKPFTPNLLEGYQGHCVVGYTIALSQSDPVVYRYSELDPRNVLKKGLCSVVSAAITRNEQTIDYDLFFPWSELGSKKLPEVPYLGFSLLINDTDADGKRKTLPFFDGINHFNPEKFGRLWLR